MEFFFSFCYSSKDTVKYILYELRQYLFVFAFNAYMYSTIWLLSDWQPFHLAKVFTARCIFSFFRRGIIIFINFSFIESFLTSYQRTYYMIDKKEQKKIKRKASQTIYNFSWTKYVTQITCINKSGTCLWPINSSPNNSTNNKI